MTGALVERTTLLVRKATQGEPGAAEELFPLVYEELRRLARSYFRGRKDQTLQPTAVVHEAYLRLVDQTAGGWKDRAHFVAVAATAMRQVLVDAYRRRQAAKRGGDWRKISLDKAAGAADSGEEVDFLELEEALARLSALDERQARVVELRFFGGLTMDEIVHVLGVSKTTVEGDWRMARAWLTSALRGG